MKVEEVRGRIDSLVELMREEKKLRVELLGLELVGPSGAVQKARERHDEIIAEVPAPRWCSPRADVSSSSPAASPSRWSPR